MKLLSVIAILSFGFLPQVNAANEKSSSIYVAPVQPTPESNQVYLRIVFPREGAMARSLPISSQLRLEGYSLSTYSQFDRAKRIYNNPEGQSIQIIIDNEPHFSLYVSFEDSFDENRNFLDKIISFEIPLKENSQLNLKSGEHVIRAFPVRSFYESLKNPHAFDASFFYLGSTKPSQNIDLEKPFITYNMPQGSYPAESSNPILLDFIVKNCRLSNDGYKVKLTIDKSFTAKLTYTTPYFIYGLPKGDHTIRLELLNENDKLVDDVNGLFNTTERIITIQ